MPRTLDNPAPALTLRPDARGWVRALRAATPTPAKAAARTELGLDPDGPLVMSGHQAEWWHPGILAKWLAADAAARATGPSARTAWVVVDQDSNVPWIVAYPTRDAKGGLVRAAWDLSAGALHAADVPTACLPPVRPPHPPTTPFPFVHDGLAAIGRSLLAHAHAASVAAQCTAALREAAGSRLPPTPVVFAASLHRLSALRDLIDRIAADPGACVRAYNEAVARHPAARLRLLDVSPSRVEVPLWRLTPGRPRRRVFAHELADTPREELAPRALLMTGVLRLAVCDLFVHGLGGEVYDPVTDEWFAAWLGHAARLTPTAVASATRTLPLGADPPTPAQIDAARWIAHHARHDPAVLGDADAAAAKARALAAVRAARGKPARLAAYRALQAELAAYRDRRAADIAQARSQADALAAQRHAAAVAHDRTWPFPLYPPPLLDALADEIGRAFGLERPA